MVAAASIVGVSANSPNGAYGAGTTLSVVLNFDSAVTVDTTGGTPLLRVNSGGSAVYASGSGTWSLTFSYTVGAGENSADLDYVSTTALVLNGGAITAGGDSALLTLPSPGAAGSLGANADWVIDTTPPTNAVASVSFSADTGISSTDFITKTAAQTISGTLNANLAAGESVYASLDNGATWQAATSAVGDNHWSLAGQTLSGSNTLKARVVDAAGNDGTQFSQAYVLDTTPPTNTVATLAFSADTGLSLSDFITNTAAQTVSGTLASNLALGEVVEVSLDNGNTWSQAVAAEGGSTWALAGQTLTGSDTLQARVVDAAGNNGASVSKAYVLDTAPPSTSIATVALSNDTGVSATDFVTSVAAQTISGTLSANLMAGESVLVSLDNGATWAIAAALVDTNGWSLTNQTLVGSNTLLAKVTDAAGNDGTVLSQAYVLEAAAVTPPASTGGPLTVIPGTEVFAGDGDDVFSIVLAGNSTQPTTTLVHGGKGDDVGVFSDVQAAYHVEQHAGFAIVSRVDDPNTQLKLINIETLRFADTSVSVQSTTAQTAVASLYQNSLGRQADSAGFDYWNALLANGKSSLGDIAVSIAQSTESSAKGYAFIGQASNDLNVLYHTILGRAADAPGLAYWSDNLADGQTLSQVANSLVTSTELMGQYKAATSWDFVS